MTDVELIGVDGDVRYRADITGYSRSLRARLREAEKQVALVATKRVRDSTHVASLLLPETLEREIARLGAVRGLLAHGYADVGDLREAYVAVAATAVICAEASNRPPQLAGRAPQPPEAFFGRGSFDWRAATGHG